MKIKSKLLISALLSILMLIMVGCSNSNNSTTTKAPTNEEYYTYLNEKYAQYFKDSKLYNDYDVYVDGFTYNGTYEEFITEYNNSYADLKTNLEAFKNDLQTNVVKGNTEVDKVNQEVITSIDKAIIAVDDYTGTFTDKAKDYATLSKDEVVKGLQSLGRAPHDAKLELDKLITDAKTTLGIK